MTFVKRLLQFFRVTDEQDNLSISQLLPILMGFWALGGEVVAQGHAGGWEGVGLFAVSAALYGAKRWRQNRPEVDARIKDLEARIEQLTKVP